MEWIKELWQRDKALLITIVVGLLVLIWYIWRQNNSGTTTTGNNPNSETPTVESEQFSAILADLGQLTPVTNSISISTQVPGPVTTITNPGPTITNPGPTITNTTTITPPTATATAGGIAGIGNDTARDIAIKAAEKKYSGSNNAANLQKAIAAITKQYPRTGPTT